jgi:hypothetical protein
MIVNNLDIIGNEYLSIARCNLKTEFKDGRYDLNQNFILSLGSKYLLPKFCTKAIYIHIILNSSIWKKNPMVVIPQDRGRLFLYHSDWDKILGHVVHYLCAIYALVYRSQSSQLDIIIAIICYLVAALLYQMLVDWSWEYFWYIKIAHVILI